MEKEENLTSIGLIGVIGVMLIVGGIFSLPFGILGIIIGILFVGGASKKVNSK